MTDGTKTAIKITGLSLVGVGSFIAVLFGSDNSQVVGIASGAVALMAGAVAFIRRFK